MELKQTPHDADAEKAILGAIILDNTLIDQAAASLTTDDFFVRGNRLIYSAMLEAREDGGDIHAVSIADRLRTSGYLSQVGGITGIAELTNGVPHFTKLDSLVKVVKKHTTLRKLLHLSSALAAKVDDGVTPADVLSFLDLKADELREEVESESAGFRHVSEIAQDVIDDIDLLEQGINPGTPSGLWLFDDATGGGIRPGELWVVAALTGQGKSALMKHIAHNMAGNNIPVGIVTAEMSDKEVFYRFLAPESGVPAWVVNKNLPKSDFAKLRHGTSQVGTLPIWIDDRTTNVFQIRSRVRSLVRRHGIKVLFVDYLQLLDVSPEDFGRFVITRAQEVAKVSRTLKKLAKELGISIVALAQFNRGANAKVDAAGNEIKPEIHQLAESGGLEKDADLVLILDMAEYERGNPNRNTTFRIAKFRRMPPFPLPYVFNGDYYIFREQTPQRDEGMFENTDSPPPRGSVVRLVETPSPAVEKEADDENPIERVAPPPDENPLF